MVHSTGNLSSYVIFLVTVYTFSLIHMTTDSFNYFLSCILLGEVLSVVF